MTQYHKNLNSELIRKFNVTLIQMSIESFSRCRHLNYKVNLEEKNKKKQPEKEEFFYYSSYKKNSSYKRRTKGGEAIIY